MTHFKPSVAPETQAKLLQLVEAGAEFIADRVGDAYDAPNIEEISGVGYSGFIPFQDGGYSASFFADNGWGSGRFINQKHREQVEAQEEAAYASFRRDYPEEAEDSEKAFEYICDWMSDPILVYFEAFIDNDEVTVRWGWNFRDAPYYREKYADDVASTILTADEFAALSVAQIMEQLSAIAS